MPSRVRSRPLVGQYHFDASRGLIPTVTFVGTLVPLMVVAPKEKVGLLETATDLASGGGVMELVDGSLLQPTNKMVAEMTPAMTAFFIKGNSAQQYVWPEVSPRTGSPSGFGDLMGQL